MTSSARARGDLEGFILCGGRSSRFGSDKALAIWRGRTLLQHALDALRPLRIPVRVVTRDPHRYAAWARCFVTREQPDRGPVEGLRAALASCSSPWALVMSVDMPGVKVRHLDRLWREVAAGAGAPGTAQPADPAAVVLFEADGRIHPFPGIYSRDAGLDRIRPLPPGASMKEVLAGFRVHAVGREAGFPGQENTLRNVNTPEDLEGLG